MPAQWHQTRVNSCGCRRNGNRCFMGAPWRLTKGAEPCAVKAARTVLNGGDEETCGNATRLVPTQPGYRARLMPGVGLLRAALLSGVARGKSRPCPTVLNHPPHRPPVTGPRAGETPAGRRAATRADRWFRRRGWVRSWPLEAAGAMAVAPDPAAACMVAYAGPRWRRRTRVGPASRHRQPGDGLGVGAWRLLLRPGRVGVSSLAWERAPGSGGGGRGSRQRRASKGGHRVPGRSCRAPWWQAPCPPVSGVCQAPSPTAHRLWRHAVARVVPRGWRRSVTGTPGHLCRSSATQQGLAGDRQ